MTVKTDEKLPEKEIVKQEPTKTETKEAILQEAKSPVQEEESQEKINWRKFREAREQERKAKEQAERLAVEKAKEAEALKAALDAVLAKPTHSNQNIYEDSSEEDEIEKKVQKALEKERERQRKEAQDREAKEMPHRLNTAYPDFNRVVTAENLDYLEYHFPGVANAFKNQSESFDKWASIYSTIKQLIPNSDNRKDQKALEKNATKPVSASVGGIATSGDHAPQMLTEQRRKDNWLRMQKVMKGLK